MNKSFIQGAATVIAVLLVIAAFKSMVDHINYDRQIKNRLVELTDKVYTLETENERYVKLLKKHDISDYEIQNYVPYK